MSSKYGWFRAFRRDSHKFLIRYVSVDEKCILNLNLDIKKESKGWVAGGEPATKNDKTLEKFRKVMTVVFFGCIRDDAQLFIKCQTVYGSSFTCYNTSSAEK